MGSIIMFKPNVKLLERRGNIMYTKLVNELLNHQESLSTITQVENLANQVLQIGKYDDINGPTPIIDIAEQFGFSTFIEPNMADDISGNIFIGGTTEKIYGTDKVIVVSENEEFFHQRFIIAHELAHYLLDYAVDSNMQDSTRLFTRTYPKDKANHNTPVEIRADRFAAELLMPKKVFCEQFAKAVMESNNMRYVIAYLSEFFETKKSSIERRISEVLN